ncbi:MAG: ATP-binding protein [bacterium]
MSERTDLLPLLGRLADAPGRVEIARQLASILGVEALILFVLNPELDALVPAPGFPQSAAHSAEWRSFLDETIALGRHQGELPSLNGGPKDHADGRAVSQEAAIILLGGSANEIEVERVLSVMPLFVAAVRGEDAVRMAQTQSRITADAVAQADELAQSLARSRVRLHEVNHELKAKTREAERAQRVAEDANRAKSVFLATMSHELRTPLNAIGGYASLLEIGIGGSMSERQLEYVRRIRASQAHLSTLVSDVLNFAKVEAGHLEYHLVALDVAAELAKVGALIEPQAAARGIRYAYSPPESPLKARADRDKLTQILLNLLTNAVKYTPSGGTVALTADQNGRFIHICVCDTGPGIPEDQREAIFEPFVQLQRRLGPDAEGVGLGLAISRDLARAMGGDLTVSDAGGVGSIFMLALPAMV